MWAPGNLPFSHHTTAMSSSFSFHKLRANARKLVPFLPPKPISPLTAKDQDALLISQLPLELRQLIWGTYFRGHAVHVYPDSERIRGRECIKRKADDDSRGPHFDVCGKANRRCNHISLLLTCKQMYLSYVPVRYPRLTVLSATLNACALFIEILSSTSHMVYTP